MTCPSESWRVKTVTEERAYLLNVGPEELHLAGDGAGNVPQPELLLPLHPLLCLPLLVMVTGTCAHQLNTEMGRTLTNTFKMSRTFA